MYLGIDIGTSSLKIIVVDAEGAVSARASSSYATITTNRDRFEQDPTVWTNALAKCLATIDPEVRACISGVSVVGQVPTLVLVDAAGRAVRRSITWQDSRSTREAIELAKRFGNSTALLGTDLPWVASQLPAKLAWIARHEPETMAATRWIVQPKDYLVLELTGIVATDAWSSKGICTVTDGTPAVQIVQACGWDPAKVPPTRLPWAPVGSITDSSADRYGLPVGISVCAGWSDAMASIVAVGGFDAPTGVVLTGTSEIVGQSATTAEAVEGLYLVPTSVAPLALAYGPTQSSGAALNWIAATIGRSVPDALELSRTATSNLPTFIPYLNGERAPVWDTSVRGVFLGLSSDHGPAELVCAVLLGVALSARHILSRAIVATGQPVLSVAVGGRGASHPAWVDARASALGSTLTIHREQNLAALGAALLAAQAAGVRLEGLTRMRGSGETVIPTSNQVERGELAFDRYLQASTISLDWSHT